MIVAPYSHSAVPLLTDKPTKTYKIGPPVANFHSLVVIGSQVTNGDLYDQNDNSIGHFVSQPSVVDGPGGTLVTFRQLEAMLDDPNYKGPVYGSVIVSGVTFYTPLVEISCQTGWCLTYGVSCDNHKLGPEQYENAYHFDAAFTINAKPESVTEEIPDGYGRVLNAISKTRNIQSLDMYGSVFFLGQLPKLKDYDYVKLIDKENNVTYDLDPKSLSFSPIGEVTKDVFFINFSFAYLDDWTSGESGCSIFKNASFISGCDNDPGDPECGTWAASIIVNDNQLTVSITGDTPEGVPVITWTKNGLYIGNSSSINTNNQPGDYKVTVNYPACPVQSDNHLIEDPCDNFSIEVSLAGLVINGVANGIPPGDTVSWSILDDAQTEVATSVPYSGSAGENYTVIATSSPSGCQRTFGVAIPASNCVHTVDIDYTNGILTGSINGCGGVESHQWTRLMEDGTEPVVSSVATYEPSETGCYKYHGTCDGCTVTAEKFVVVNAATNVNVINSDQHGRKYHENNSVTGAFYEVPGFELPNPSLHTEDQINDLVRLYINKQKFTYKTSPTDPEHFSITVSNTQNRIVPQIAFDEDVFEIYRNSI